MTTPVASRKYYSHFHANFKGTIFGILTSYPQVCVTIAAGVLRGFMVRLPANILRAIRALPLVALLLFSIWAYPVAAKYPCAKLDETLRIYLATGYALLLSGDLITDAAIIILVNTNGPEYVILGVDNDLRACILLRGSNLMFFDGSEA